MKTRVDARFRAEVIEYALRFDCESCAHFVEARRACGNGYPNGAHLRQALDEITELEFCKEFELS